MEELINKLSEEEKKAIEFFKAVKNLKIILSCSFWNNGEFEFNSLQKKQFEIVLNIIKNQQEQLQEKDKIIDMMAEKFTQINEIENPIVLGNKTVIIEYFTKKAREV